MLEIAGNSSCINPNTRWKLSGQIKYLLLDIKERVGLMKWLYEKMELESSGSRLRQFILQLHLHQIF